MSGWLKKCCINPDLPKRQGDIKATFLPFSICLRRKSVSSCLSQKYLSVTEILVRQIFTYNEWVVYQQIVHARANFIANIIIWQYICIYLTLNFRDMTNE